MAETEHQQIDVTAKVEKAGMSTMQWVAVVGVGSVLLVILVPWMMRFMSADQAFIHSQWEKLLDKTDKATDATLEAASKMDALSGNVQELTDEHRELCAELKPTIRQLDRVADAVLERVEQEKSE